MSGLFSISNIGLSAYNHVHQFQPIRELGIVGLEVAPSRVWQDTWQGLTPGAVSKYRRHVETSGLRVVGLHSLLFDQQHLGLFGDVDMRIQTVAFIKHLSGVCRDLGGRTLIWGAGRRRGNRPETEAALIIEEFLGAVCSTLEADGTILCFEPLGPKDTDFLNTAQECIALVKRINSPSLQLQLDAKALIENDEASLDTFLNGSEYLVHFHANAPGLAPLTDDGKVPHKVFGEYLKQINYNGYISIEQRMANEEDPLVDLFQSISVLKECYG